MPVDSGKAMAISREQIIQLYKSNKLLRAFSIRFERLNSTEMAGPITLCIEAHNSGDINLLSLLESPEFDEISSRDFFAIQQVYIKLIPDLNAPVDDMMHCVDVLVAKAGDDLAGNLPFTAFTTWCANDLQRAYHIVAEAVDGNNLATDHLSFALEALDDVTEARRIMLAFNGNRRLAAITALGRISHNDLTTVKETIEQFTSVVSDDQDESTLSALMGVLPKILDGIGTFEDAGATELLYAVTRSHADGVLHWVAAGLFSHSAVFTKQALKIAFDALRKLKRSNKGTVDYLDTALSQLMHGNACSEVTELVKDLLLNSDQGFKISDFDSFGGALVSTNQAHFHKTLVAWLGSGNQQLCKAISELLQSIEDGGVIVDIPAEFLPEEPALQFFLARKAIGFFFISPVTAASILVSILRVAHKDSRSDLEDLLFDPMQINYGGDLSTYLKSIAQDDLAFDSVQRSIERREAYINGLDQAGVIKELHPSQMQRDRARRKSNDEVRRSFKDAQKKSVFLNLVKRSVLLHGRKSVSMVYGPGGESRPMEIQMQSHGVSAEFPRLSVIDPIGINYKIRSFRVEQLIDEADHS